MKQERMIMEIETNKLKVLMKFGELIQCRFV